LVQSAQVLPAAGATDVQAKACRHRNRAQQISKIENCTALHRLLKYSSVPSVPLLHRSCRAQETLQRREQTSFTELRLIPMSPLAAEILREPLGLLLSLSRPNIDVIHNVSRNTSHNTEYLRNQPKRQRAKEAKGCSRNSWIDRNCCIRLFPFRTSILTPKSAKDHRSGPAQPGGQHVQSVGEQG
jgi:hypothetical protein